MFHHYAHMCRDDHMEVGFNDSKIEPCPMCVTTQTLLLIYGITVDPEVRDAAEKALREVGVDPDA